MALKLFSYGMIGEFASGLAVADVGSAQVLLG